MDDNQLFGRFNTVFAGVGALCTLYAATKIVVFLLKSIKMFVLRLGTNLKKYGTWAAVTGATDGIGKAYAEQLASKGLNIVLLSRTESKLEAVAAEIRSKYNVETKIIAVDFSGGVEIYSDIAAKLEGLEVGVLVNNVGTSYSYPQYFCELPEPEKFIPSLITTNCLAVTMMTNIVLPSMLSRKKGLIINVASAAGTLPSPLLTVYSGTKAYVDFFSRSLNTEYASKGIIVQSVLPFFVVSKLSKIRKSSLTVPTATSYVKSALATVGTETRTFGCFMHNLQGAVGTSFPESVVVYFLTSMLLAGRKRLMEAEKTKTEQRREDNANPKKEI
ncbi:Very-long-chain 3-oxoacyl-CoA reductase [Holothuria leucospilota]|uniref:Very-long-chain 3-oxoacyl-CoA reductase n=1 Tax=Holothuria leucospilota TaxID=206669 RepID=A0A9Q1CSD4_HOLLE|nr:Very-long-chain 3-oxoacyl-CoA reductase [Holothuria leucospilota]